MRSVLGRAVPAAIVLALLAAPAFARSEGTVDLFLGNKWLLYSDWTPVDQQPEVGLLLAFAQERSPVRFAIEVLASSDSATTADPVFGEVKVTGSTIEYGVGIRKEWGRGLFRPRIASGGALVEARAEHQSRLGVVRRDRTGVGFWVAGGLAFRIARHFDLGLDLRYSKSTVDFGQGLEDVQVEGGGFHAGLVLGYGW